MILTIDKFVNHLKNHNVIGIEITKHEIPEGDSFDLPDPRTSAIYPPQPHRIQKGYIEKPYEILECKLWKGDEK